jgi:hypothetical protein
VQVYTPVEGAFDATPVTSAAPAAALFVLAALAHARLLPTELLPWSQGHALAAMQQAARGGSLEAVAAVGALLLTQQPSPGACVPAASPSPQEPSYGVHLERGLSGLAPHTQPGACINGVLVTQLH